MYKLESNIFVMSQNSGISSGPPNKKKDMEWNSYESTYSSSESLSSPTHKNRAMELRSSYLHCYRKG